MADLFCLSGKVAVVTGSTRGIGRGIAQELARAGARVVVSSESVEDTAKATEAMRKQGFDVIGIPCNVTNEGELAQLVSGAVANFGGIDILVCNAGITGQAGSTEVEDFDVVMAVNLRSAIALSHLALPEIAKRGGGSVVLISSLSGLRGNANINAYALSKAGIAQLARNLAVQWGSSNIRVNAISPGLIRTEFSAPLIANEAFMAKRMTMTPLRRVGEISEVAGAAVFLSSAAGAFVSGHNLVVDGGTLITDGS